MNKEEKINRYINFSYFILNELKGVYDIVLSSNTFKIYIKDDKFSLNKFHKIEEKIEKIFNQKLYFSFFSIFPINEKEINIILTFNLEESLI